MKSKYPSLTLLAGIITIAAILFGVGVFTILSAVTFIAVGQLAILSRSQMQARCFLTGLSETQIKEFEEIMESMSGKWAAIEKMLEKFPDLEKKFTESHSSVQKVMRTLATGAAGGIGNSGVRWVNNVPFVTDDCARSLTSIFVLECDSLRALETLVKDSGTRAGVLAMAKDTLGVAQRTALSGAEIPLPTVYAPQIIELVFRYGQARQFGTVFPLGAGTVKLPRLKAGEDDFGYIGIGTAGMGQPIPEKRPATELVTFNANKAGGLIRIPFELEQDTFIPIGQFLARYIARQLAKLEDRTMFLADGTATYANQTGIAKYCETNTDYLLQLANDKTAPSDITLENVRNLRAKVSPAILGNMAANGQTMGAYYMHPTFEPFLRSMNKYPNFIVFEYVNGVPMLDGWPVRWIGVSQPYTTGAAPSKPCMFFGDLSYWYLGERGNVRVEVSREVFFATDELAMRALERIDVQGLAVDAMATLETGAGA